MENQTIDIDSIVPLPLNDKNPLISASMIVKNEEKFLPGCLESMRGVIDELVIVDTGSTDKTIEIAKSYGAKLYQIEWKDDFSYARNESLKHCTGKWVLYIDADERLKKETSQNLRKMAINATNNLGAFICIVESKHLTKEGQLSNQRSGYPRFFRNYGYPIIEFSGRIHEQIASSISELNKEVAFSDVVIEHLGYEKSPEIMDSKILRNYKLLTEQIKETPEDSNAWFHFAETLALMNLYKESEDALRMAINLGTLEDYILSVAYSLLGQLEMRKESLNEALKCFQLSLQAAPEQQAVSFHKATVHYLLDQPEQALEALNNIRKVKKTQDTKIATGFDIEVNLSAVDTLEQKCQDMLKLKGNANDKAD